MPQLFSLPSIRRASFQAPDPAAVAALGLAAGDPADEPVVPADPVSPADPGSAADPAAATPTDPADPTGPATPTSPAHRSDQRGARPAGTHGTPRHRAEPIGNRRPSAAAARRIAALGCATVILGGSAFGAAAASADEAPATTSVAAGAASGSNAQPVDPVAAAAADELVSAIDAQADAGPVVTSGLSTAAAPFTGGTQVTVQGQHLDEVTGVSVGGNPAPIVSATADAVTFAVPAVDDAVRGAVEVAFTDASGRPVDIETPMASAAASVGPSAVTTELTGIANASVRPAGTTQQALTLTITDDERINAQVDYVLTYWSSYNTAQYTVLSGVDCANFASQSLVARGWAMDGTWYYDAATGAMGPAWSSSTAMRDWLLSRPDLATPLDDSQRDQVKVGDIAQFDWDSSGDRDHTAVVTRVEHTDAGTRIWVGGHTKDADYWDVDEALATGGGSVTYFSLN